MGLMVYFLDVPVYRLKAKKYYEERKHYVEKIIFPPNDPSSERWREQERENSNQYLAFKDHLERNYGGIWRYNEIIGYIRLHFLGSQIRGEYFRVQAKRIVRSRRKIFEWQTHKLSYELSLPQSPTNENVYRTIEEYLNNCQKILKDRYVDTEIFEIIGPYVDWLSLIAKHLK